MSLIPLIAGFGMAGILVWLWRRWPRGSAFTPAPYVVLPEMTDEQMRAHPFLTLRRFHVMAVMEGTGGYRSAIVLGPLCATEEEALQGLAGGADHPGARAVPVVLGFDPENPAAMHAYFVMVEGHDSPAGLQ